METAISVSKLRKIYSSGAGEFLALDGVDLDVHPGEVVLLMGPSGSGKTTLVSIMGCILRATSGSVRIRGREVGDLGVGDRRVGLNQRGEITEAGAEDQTDFGSPLPAEPNGGLGFSDLIEESVHEAVPEDFTRGSEADGTQ